MHPATGLLRHENHDLQLAAGLLPLWMDSDD
jgi:hypothetical protein